MRTRIVAAVLLLMFAPGVFGQVSYWFQGFQRQGNARDAQEYFFLPGAGMTFTYANNRVYLNAAGGGAFVPAGTGFFHATAGVQDAAAQLVTLTAGTDVAVNQGTTTTVLHGNAAGLPSWGAVNLATDVAGILPGASVSGVWHLAGDALGAPGSFLGSTDNQALQLRVNNLEVGFFDTDFSLSLGRGASAVNAGDIAIGYSTTGVAPFATANGVNSVAIGATAMATANSAVAIGPSATSSAQSSAAIGQATTASADYAVALGAGSTASGVGSFASGQSAVASGDNSFAMGPATLAGPGTDAFAFGNGAGANGLGSYAIGYSALAATDLSFALGTVPVTSFQGSFVWSDSTVAGNTDTAQDQFIVTATGGSHYYLGGNGIRFDDGGAALTSVLTNGAAYLPGATNIFTGTTIHSNVVYVGCVTNVMNGIAGYPTTTTNVPIKITPVGLFGYLGFFGTNTLNLVTADVYVNVASNGIAFNRVLTNRFGASLSKGMLTNHIAGYYGIQTSFSALGDANVNGNEYEIEVFINGIAEEFLSDQVTAANVNNVWGATHGGIVYLAANSVVEVRMKQIAGVIDDPDITRLYLRIGTP